MTLDAVTHKNILVQILKDIYTDETIGSILGFKGGTAAYLFYDLSRVSVDLDFDLLDLTKADYVFDQFKKILEPYGLIKEAQKKRYCLFFLLSYHNKLANAYNIKVEVNLRDFGSRYEIKSYFGIPMKVMVQPDMAAHKMVAMLERIGKTNRDIFDVWFFLKNNWPVNEKIIETRTGLSMKQFLQRSIDELEALSDRGILSGIGELLDAKQKAWVKEKLRSETLFLLKMKLSS
jgi:predicted nucleotidyltransferase component of viral defense system